MQIQHAARWTSTKQLKTYDLTNQEDAFQVELEKRGIVPTNKAGIREPKLCAYCNKTAGFGDTLCKQCKRPLDREKILEEQAKPTEEMESLREELKSLRNEIRRAGQQSIQGMMTDLLLDIPQGPENGQYINRLGKGRG